MSSKEVKYLIAITGCPAGIAHTYMAAKKIEDFAKSKGWKVKVEKQGANGIEDKLTVEDVENADILLISADINPSGMERFKDIPMLKTSVVEPLRNMERLWQRLLDSKENWELNATNEEIKAKSQKESKKFRAKFKHQVKGLRDAILTGISFVVPIIVAGTTIVALATIIQQIAGKDNEILWLTKLSDVAGGALSILLAPVLSAYIAYAMADKIGLFSGFMGGLACNAVTLTQIINGKEQYLINGLGFLGGLVSGIICGYMMIVFKKYLVSKRFQGVLTWFVYPVLSSLIIISLILFAIGTPIALLIKAIFDGLNVLQDYNLTFLLGMIIGGFCVLDLGGPFNKVAWAFAIAAFTSENPLYAPYTAFWAAGIGTGWTTTLVTKVFAKKFATKAEKDAGNIAWAMSSLGITEGSIPFMLADPIRVMIGFVLGGATAGGLSYALNIGSNIMGGGFITAAGIVPLINILWFILIALLGCLISTSTIVGLKFLSANKKLESKVKKVSLNIFTFGLINFKKKNMIKNEK